MRQLDPLETTPVSWTTTWSMKWGRVLAPLGTLGLATLVLWILAPGPTSQAGPGPNFAGGGLCHAPGEEHAHSSQGPDIFRKNGVPGTAANPWATGGGSHSLNCPAGNARDNVYSPPYEVGIDYIPLTTDDSIGFHVVYSGKATGTGAGVALNSAIYLFEQSDGNLLVFGGGYGDPFAQGTALNNAAFDVANILAVVQQCMGKDPYTTKVDFVWPHWHGDHGNDEFIHALENAGFDIRSIGFHTDDASFIYGFGWNSNDYSKFVEFPDAGCNVPIATYQTTVGKVWFSARSGHTAGAIDMVLDIRGNIHDRFQIRGSVQGTLCPVAPDGTTDQIESHNNVVLTNLAQAVPYGCVNPFGSLTYLVGPPKPNRLQTFGIDDPTGSVAPGAFTFILVSDRASNAMPCGVTFDNVHTGRLNELLVDLPYALSLSPPILGEIWTGPGVPALASVRIPPDNLLNGTSLYVQGFLVNPVAPDGRRLALTDGMELRIR